jgi:hypothetical protein
MAAQTITEIVRADELSAYLARYGLRVVRGGWRWGNKRPYLITGPALPAETVSDNEGKGEADEERD